MPKKSNTKLARAKALQGDTDAAIALLTPDAAADPTAAASLMQLHAFRGQWAEVVRLGLPLVDRFDAFDTMNVYEETVALVAWAGVNGVPLRAVELKQRIKKESLPQVRIQLQNAGKLLSDPKKHGRNFLSDNDPDPKGYAEAVEVMRESEPKLWSAGKAAELTERLLGIARLRRPQAGPSAGPGRHFESQLRPSRVRGRSLSQEEGSEGRVELP